jgi:hypothetical protein
VELAARYYFLSECVEVKINLLLTVSQYVLVSSTFVELAARCYFLSECVEVEVTLRLTVSQSSLDDRSIVE